MKVKEAISILETLDPEAELLYPNIANGSYNKVSGISNILHEDSEVIIL